MEYIELLQLWEVSVRGNFPSELGRLTNLGAFLDAWSLEDALVKACNSHGRYLLLDLVALLLVSGTNVTGTIPAGLMHLTKLRE